ncbi:MAG: glycosyltransferase family 2 protein [Thermoflexales bacterium]|nr:glycosyltransferase family 2 protein [Thermoflexales bacterium]
MNELDLAIVIVNWNVRELLAACLEALFRFQLSAFSFQVVVVDNASRDGSVEMVRGRFPQVRLIANSHNEGFAGGNNQGLRELGLGARHSTQSIETRNPKSETQGPDRPRYVLLLNPDTLVREGAIAAMVDFMDRTPQAGACGARLVYGDGSFQHSAFGFPGLAQIGLDFWPLHGRLLESRLNGRYPRRLYAAGRPFEVDHPLGAALMVRAEAIAHAGLMDEGFHMYCEEIDWCWHIKAAGWRIYCVPQAEIVHYGGQSSAQARPEMIVALWRSRKRLYTTYYPAWKRRLAFALVRAGARAQAGRLPDAALANAYRQVGEMFKT